MIILHFNKNNFCNAFSKVFTKSKNFYSQFKLKNKNKININILKSLLSRENHNLRDNGIFQRFIYIFR